MKVIINNKRYDTDKATKIYEWDNGLHASDFRNLSIILYRTERGAWFLHAYGGPLTCCARPAAGGGSTGGSRIIPLSDDAEVFDFLINHKGYDKAEELFPELIEDA